MDGWMDGWTAASTLTGSTEDLSHSAGTPTVRLDGIKRLKSRYHVYLVEYQEGRYQASIAVAGV